MNAFRTDVLVVGLGAVGAATLYQLAKRGAKVIGVDRFSPPHEQGSSHGETRITRQGIGEGRIYGPLVRKSHDVWRELESETGRSLLLTCGALILGPRTNQAPMHGKPNFIDATLDAAVAGAVPHEVLASDELARRYPQLGLAGDEIGYFEPGGGLVYPERCIAAQLEQARKLGAEIVVDEHVLSLDATPHGVRLQSDKNRYEVDQVVLAGGAWTPALAGSALRSLALQPQTLHWFEANDPTAYEAARFPVFIWIHGPTPDDLFYGFPIPPNSPTRGVKVARESSVAIDHPDHLDRFAAHLEAERMYSDHVAGRLRGIGPRALKSVACIYTTAPDGDFVLGPSPQTDRILIASACSGHGFKHSAAVGELLATVALSGDCSLIPDAFALTRPSLRTAGERR